MNFYLHSKIKNIIEKSKSNIISNPEFEITIILVKPNIKIISEAIILQIVNFCYAPIFIESEFVYKIK